MNDDDAWGALAELVRLKDIRDDPDLMAEPEVAAAYRRDKDAAWGRARDALTRHHLHEQQVAARLACHGCGHPRTEHDKIVGCLIGWATDRTQKGCACLHTPASFGWVDMVETLRRTLSKPGGVTVMPDLVIAPKLRPAFTRHHRFQESLQPPQPEKRPR